MGSSDNFSSITVNGKPLADVLVQETCNEIQEAITDAALRKPRRPVISKHKTFTNGITRNLKLADPEPDFTRWVIMRGIMYLRASKEPLPTSGASLLGALEYDPDTDKIKCHVPGCGQWFVNYGGH